MAHRTAAAHTPARSKTIAWTRRDGPLRKDLSDCAIAFLTDAYLILKLNFRPAIFARLGFLPKFGPLSRWLAGSVDETTHTYVHHESQRQKYKGRCGSSVTHQRQRNSGYRH